MTTKDFLASMHDRSAAFHRKAAAHHNTLAECYKARDGFSAEAKEHGALAKCHEEEAAYHSDNSKTLKASAAADLAKIRPDNISSVQFADAPASAFGVRAVPRTGQPTEPLTKTEIAAIDPRFRHLVSGMDQF